MDSARVPGRSGFGQSLMRPFSTCVLYLTEMERYIEAFTAATAGARHFYGRKEAIRISWFHDQQTYFGL
jgi:hypothetical protein